MKITATFSIENIDFMCVHKPHKQYPTKGSVFVKGSTGVYCMSV